MSPEVVGGTREPGLYWVKFNWWDDWALMLWSTRVVEEGEWLRQGGGRYDRVAVLGDMLLSSKNMSPADELIWRQVEPDQKGTDQ